jgi:hypothetical protein
MNVHTIGIDLGKARFHLVGLKRRAEVIVRKQLARVQILCFTANRKVHLIGTEAAGALFPWPCAPRAGTRGTSDSCPVCGSRNCGELPYYCGPTHRKSSSYNRL